MPRNAKDPRINQIIVSGRLTRDPELAHSTNGKTYAKTSMAVDGWGKDAPPTFYNITAFGKTAEFAANDLRKGDMVCAVGRHDGSEFEYKGERRKRNDITCTELRGMQWPEDDAPAKPAPPRYTPRPRTEPTPDDDIPF